MYCTPQTLTAINKECGSNVGGVKVTAFRNRADVESVTIVDGMVTAVTLATGAAEDAAVVSFRPQTAAFTHEATIDQANGTFFYTHTLALRLAKMTAAKRTSVVALTHADTIALVKDNNGNVWLTGYDEPLMASADTGGTGTAHTDPNEYAPTFSCMAELPPMPVEAAAVATFLGSAEF